LQEKGYLKIKQEREKMVESGEVPRDLNEYLEFSKRIIEKTNYMNREDELKKD
jgi:hypothetical protein